MIQTQSQHKEIEKNYLFFHELFFQLTNEIKPEIRWKLWDETRSKINHPIWKNYKQFFLR